MVMADPITVFRSMALKNNSRHFNDDSTLRSIKRTDDVTDPRKLLQKYKEARDEDVLDDGGGSICAPQPQLPRQKRKGGSFIVDNKVDSANKGDDVVHYTVGICSIHVFASFAPLLPCPCSSFFL